jgi:hypothetical protein
MAVEKVLIVWTPIGRSGDGRRSAEPASHMRGYADRTIVKVSRAASPIGIDATNDAQGRVYGPHPRLPITSSQRLRARGRLPLGTAT